MNKIDYCITIILRSVKKHMAIITPFRKFYERIFIEICYLFFYLKILRMKNSMSNTVIWELLVKAKNPDSSVSKFLLQKIVDTVNFIPNEKFHGIINKEDMFIRFCLLHWRTSQAQLFQDLWVLFELNKKEQGFFVEFGATDGISLSNTYLLEKKFRWYGILVEPCPIWHSRLKINRNSLTDFRCVWSDSKSKIKFLGSENPEFSTISSFSSNDHYAYKRQNGVEYFVDTISLTDLLIEHNAPKNVDFLSIDTEGSEFEILSSFNFDLFSIQLISVEHNFLESKRLALFNFLSTKGYKRVFENFSQYDDWYIHESICSVHT